MCLKLATQNEQFLTILKGSCFISTIKKIRDDFNFKSWVRLYLYETRNELNYYINIPVPNWVKAMSFDNNILIIENKNLSEQLLLHEFTHSATKIYKANGCPLWLFEGLALYYSSEHIGIINSYISNLNKMKIIEFLKANLDSIYFLDYNSEYFYFISSLIIHILIKQYSLSIILFKLGILKTYSQFEQDEFLGIQNIKSLVKNFANSITNEVIL